MSASAPTRRIDDNGDRDREDGGRHRPPTREQVAASIYAELALVVRSIRAHAANLHPGLSLTGYALLLHLGETGGSRAAELAEYYNLNKSTVSRQLAELAASGLVERELDASDNRVQIVRVTAAGRALLAKAGEVFQESLLTRLDAWPDADLVAFAQMLARYNAPAGDDTGAAQAESTPPPPPQSPQPPPQPPPQPTGTTGAAPWT